MRTTAPSRALERGAAAFVSLVLALVVGGLSVSLLQEALGSRATLSRHDANIRALEIAETGLVRGEIEITGNHDSGLDGVGAITGTFGGGTYTVTATRDVPATDLWVLRCRATFGLSTRTIEEEVKRVPNGIFRWAAFGRDGVTISASPTDAYDSRLGTYASQQVHVDSKGPYAQLGGSVGSDRGITLSGSTKIRGDATPGPGYTTSGTPTMVTGTTTPMSDPVSLPYTPIEDFQQAMASPQNGTWTNIGGSLTYNPAKRTLTISGGGTLVLNAGTYFLTDITVSGGSTVKINGAVKLYTTGKADFSGGSIVNVSGQASDFQIFSHPYTSLVPGYTPSTTSVTISGGGTGAYAVVYAPESPLTFSGGGNIYGSYIAKTVTNSGGSFVHYDAALAELGGMIATLTHLSWREPNPPRR